MSLAIPTVDELSQEEVESSSPITLMGWIGGVICASAVFLNLADFIHSKEGNVLDVQVLLKLAVCGSAGLYGLWGLSRHRTAVYSIASTPGLWITIIGVFFLISVPFSIDKKSSIVSATLFWTIFLMVPAVLAELGVNRTLKAAFVGLVAFVGLSWVFYLFLPELGVFEEALADAEFQERMYGISHPNMLGIYSGMLMLIGFYLGLKKEVAWTWLIPTFLAAFGALVLCLSRTSMVAFLLAFCVAYWRYAFRPPFQVFTLAGAVLILLVGMYVASAVDIGRSINSFAVLITKSGDIDELLTATGRNEIWKFAIEKIQEKPLFGHGLATSKVVMAEYSMYTHNRWLNGLSAPILRRLLDVQTQSCGRYSTTVLTFCGDFFGT